MINKVRFAFGSSVHTPPLDIDPRPITVLVGPNNSGKSLTLREVETWCKSGSQQPRVAVADIEVDVPSPSQALEELKTFELRPPRGQAIPTGNILVGRSDPHQGVSQQYIDVNQLPNYLNNPMYIGPYFLAFFTLRLDGRTRFSLTEPRPSGDLLGPAQNHLMSLFQDDTARKEVRRIVEDAFGSYFVIDPTGMTTLRIKVSERPPVDDAEEQSWDPRARAFHEAARDVLDLSDGVQAFTGIVAAVLSANYKVVLIDEPEAFLAPTLAKKLGSRLATLAQEREGCLFAATHSADFLMGCVQAGANINIVRLTYRGGNATARLLQPETLLRFMNNPLLRSTNVLSALFYESAVVTEADTDRAFYQEINQRLLDFDCEGIDNCLFLNARNKQSVPEVAGPLREIGIPAALILDLDVIKDGGQDWSRLLDSANLPETSRTALNNHRTAVKRAFDESGKDMKKDGGIAILDKDAQESCNSLLDQLAQYGIFIVPSGEVESWLAELGAGSHGPGWLVQVFDLMGTNPAELNYVQPQGDGVWEFVEKIGHWLRDENRKGMPE